MNQIRKTALIDAVATALYIMAVGGFMYYGALIKIGRNNSFLTPIALLLLFVLSAAVTGFLIFGKPGPTLCGREKE